MDKQEEEKKIKYQMIFDCSNQLTQIGILRYQSLTIITALTITILGVIAVSSNIIINVYFFIISCYILGLVAILSFIIFLKQTREDMFFLIERARKIPEIDLTDNKKEKINSGGFYWPEIFFAVFLVSILFFILSILNL